MIVPPWTTTLHYLLCMSAPKSSEMTCFIPQIKHTALSDKIFRSASRKSLLSLRFSAIHFIYWRHTVSFQLLICFLLQTAKIHTLIPVSSKTIGHLIYRNPYLPITAAVCTQRFTGVWAFRIVIYSSLFNNLLKSLVCVSAVRQTLSSVLPDILFISVANAPL